MNLVSKTIIKVRHTISRYKMFESGDRVIVAVSGGPDSVCLLDILREIRDGLGIELVVAHFDHGLRPDEDEDETRFVESLAGSLGLPFETGKAGSGMGPGEPSLEEKARKARYGFLEAVKEKFSARKIAMGHNLNDQAETVIMRLLRGSGLSGLAGIPPCREEEIVRPLIEITRGEIESYIEKRGLKYVTDSSNLEIRHLRNRIRFDLLPQLRRYQPRIVELLGQTADIMRRDDECLEAVAEQWVRDMAENRDNREVQIPLSAFRELPEGLRNRVIRVVLRITGGGLRRVSSRHIEAVNRVAMGKKSQAFVNLPNRLAAKRVYDDLIITTAGDKVSTDFHYSLEGPGTFRLESPGCTISLKETDKKALVYAGISRWTAFLNADKLTYPLIVRNFRPGDRFVPFGMSGHKKLKDFFIDLKIPSEVRAQIPVLVCQDNIVWVCGLRIDDRFRVTPDSRKVLKIDINDFSLYPALTRGRDVAIPDKKEGC